MKNNKWKNNRISVIIPTYNSAQTLSKCLESIFSQTYKNVEVIVVNDGSTDNTREILEKYKSGSNGSLDPLLEVRSCFRQDSGGQARSLTEPFFVIHQENKGAPAARNRGFRESQGEYIIFVDSDVYLKPECLDKMQQTLVRRQEASYAYCSFKWGWKKFKLWEFDADKLKQMPYIHTTSLIRRSAFPVSGFDESLKRFQDWDLWLSMLDWGHKGVWISEVLFATSTKKNTMSSWIPAFVYNHLPWIDKRRIGEYDKAREIILKKHNLVDV